jgi:hypothetical protein
MPRQDAPTLSLFFGHYYLYIRAIMQYTFRPCHLSNSTLKYVDHFRYRCRIVNPPPGHEDKYAPPLSVGKLTLNNYFLAYEYFKALKARIYQHTLTDNACTIKSAYTPAEMQVQ